jgi:hypothetical protein
MKRKLLSVVFATAFALSAVAQVAPTDDCKAEEVTATWGITGVICSLGYCVPTWGWIITTRTVPCV